MQLIQSRSAPWLAAVLLAFATTLSSAAPVKVEAVMSPKEQIRMDFADGSNHFVLMVKREGEATGQGVLAGTAVTEFGRHDIIPASAEIPAVTLCSLGPKGASHTSNGPSGRCLSRALTENRCCSTTAYGRSLEAPEISRGCKVRGHFTSRQCRPQTATSFSTANWCHPLELRNRQPGPAFALPS